MTLAPALAAPSVILGARRADRDRRGRAVSGDARLQEGVRARAAVRAVGVAGARHDVTLDHFRDLFGARGGHGELLFLRHALNSLVVALATTVVGVALSCTAAYALSRFRFPGRKAGLTTFLVVQMFPATLLLMPLYVILNKLGLLNSVAGLVLVYSTTAIPFCVWTLKGYFDSLPRELEEAARIDGASPWMIFRKIILPLARPGIAVTALFSFMTAWNEFIMASTFMTDESRYTLPVLIQSERRRSTRPTTACSPPARS